MKDEISTNEFQLSTSEPGRPFLERWRRAVVRVELDGLAEMFHCLFIDSAFLI